MVFEGCSTMRQVGLIIFRSTQLCQVHPRSMTKRAQHLNSRLHLYFGVRDSHWHVHLGTNTSVVHCKTLIKPASLSTLQGRFAALVGCLYSVCETGA